MKSDKVVKSDCCVYQIKVTLKHSQPPIWRRIQVKSNITLNKLHQILQTVMPWEEDHLHQFVIGNVFYDIPIEDHDPFIETEDERKYRLAQLITGKGFRFTYEYDFGDSWEHLLLVEEVLPLQKEVSYPFCMEGKRACPPEDIGGIPGYYDFLSIITNPKHPKYGNMREWAGEDFDPEVFDLQKTNKALRRVK